MMPAVENGIKSGSSGVFGKVRRIVLKVGTRLVSDERFMLDTRALEVVAANVMAARARGADVVLVTSGAVGAGMGLLGLKTRPAAITEKQACAAAGQSLLMHEYQKAFSKHRVKVAQILITRSDIADRRRHQNVRRVMNHLLAHGVLPIVNENDAVADEELKFGDNDSLSGLVADLVDADGLVLLTDVDGLHDREKTRQRIPVVTSVSQEILAMAGGAGSVSSTGGMITKVRTAERMARAGRVTVIASGRDRDIVKRILDGDDVGTIFLPSGRKLEARKRWIADHLVPRGRIIVDSGAAHALRRKGGSLLPSGIRAVDGHFTAGSAVEVLDESGVVVGQGLAAYGAREIQSIKGLRSDRISGALGFSRGEEVIHRNDLAVISNP
jgi:glutamate 5-kinase